MSSRRWLLTTVLVTIVTAAAIAGANAMVDPFGLFRSPRKRSLPVYGEERIAKYLLSRRYVPQNYDGVLIGSSVTANWDVSGMRSARLYNQSLNGGNVVESRPIIDAALSNWTPRVAVLLVHPYFTSSHEFNAIKPTEREVLGALGSLNLIEAYKIMIKVRLGRERADFDGNGTAFFGDRTRKLNAVLTEMMRPGMDFSVDEVARREFQAIVASLRSRNVPLVFVVPPLAEHLFAAKREAFAKYLRETVPDLRPEDLLDFTSERFAGLRSHPDYFSDGVHMRPAGTVAVVAELDAFVESRLKDSRPH